VTLLLAVREGGDWGWGSAISLTPFLVGAVAMVVFVLFEMRVREPLINMRLLALRGVWTTNLVGLTFGFVMYGMFLLIPTLLELPAATGYGFGKHVTSAGLFLLPTTLAMLVFGPMSGSWTAVTVPRSADARRCPGDRGVRSTGDRPWRVVGVSGHGHSYGWGYRVGVRRDGQRHR
jgi:hypothetical protein